jgi:hypothetical protein
MNAGLMSRPNERVKAGMSPDGIEQTSQLHAGVNCPAAASISPCGGCRVWISKPITLIFSIHSIHGAETSFR